MKTFGLNRFAIAGLSFAFVAGAGAAGAEATGRHAAAPRAQYPWGEEGVPRKVTRTIDVVMSDSMRFNPDRIDVVRGETVRLRVANRGRVLHELVIGTRAELDAHAALMAKFPGMKHHEPYMVHVPPGKSGEIVWTFRRAGDFEFACLIAGHYQAGMVGRLIVAERQ